MTKKEFEESYCDESHITIDEYNENFVTIECHCSDPSCKGWACVSNNKASIKAYIELYGMK